MPDLKDMFLPTATGRQGIHISAELRVNAMQLQAHRIGWAADCMERAARHIDALEDDRMRLLGLLEKKDATVQEG